MKSAPPGRSAAIEAAGTLETDAVAAQLRSLDMFDVFGRMRFDANGQGTVAMIPLQHVPGSGAQAMVSEASLAFPMPTWPQRWCQQLGPGKTYADYAGEVLSVECSGHGQCNARGACVISHCAKSRRSNCIFRRRAMLL